VISIYTQDKDALEVLDNLIDRDARSQKVKINRPTALEELLKCAPDILPSRSLIDGALEVNDAD